MKNIIKSGFMLAAIVSAPSYAGYTFDLGDKDSITFGGFIKADIRTVSGDVSAPATGNDYWIGAASVTDDISTTKFTANETRFNAKYVHGDVTGFIELDFYGGGGNQIISNSSHPRLRHAFIKYKNITVGQTWTTFMNTSAIPESADFGGPLVAESFIRQGQIRYTNGGLQVSLENPHSDKGDNTQDSIPDFIAKYTFKGDWGNVSVSGVARQLNTIGGDTVSAAGFGVAGRIKTFGKDDFRFQVHGGETGRYVSVVTARDLVGEEAEQSTSIMAAYRHYWTEDMRSTVYYGTTDTDLGNVKNNHVAVNLFKNYTKQLSFGVEVGNFEMAEVNKNSNYLQFSAKYVL
jgi:hypothetical protein